MTIRRNKSSVSIEQLERAEAEIVERSRRIDFQTTEYSIELLADKMERKEFIIPKYQRNFNWELARKSRFIESLIMGLPIPFLFFWTNPDGFLEIVDGSQRLRTIQEYIKNDLRLSDLQSLPSLSKTRFADLLASRQRKIKNLSIRGIILNERADEQARIDMFDRINTGSLNAKTAEIRRGALPGPFLDLVVELSESELLAKLAPMSAKAKNEGVLEELVARFFAYGDGLEGYRDNPSPFIFDYTKTKNAEFEADPTLADDYRDRFFNVMTFVKNTFPMGFTKAQNANSTPRVRFEAIAIGSYMALQERPTLSTPPYPNINSWIYGDDFKDVTTSDAANVKSKIIKRFEYVRDALLA
jgi:hypothetical protein